MLALLGSANPQQPARTAAPVVLEGYQEGELAPYHLIGQPQALHWTSSDIQELTKDGSRFRLTEGFIFDIVVAEDGSIESAQLRGLGKPHADEAAAIEKAKRFRPWLRDGVPVRVALQDYVAIYPPEKWGPDVRFPEHPDPSTVTMTLTRSTCYGQCPAYTVSVSGDGTVRFEGRTNTRIPGHHLAHIAKESAKELLGRFREARFLSALPEYVTSVTDSQTRVLTLHVGGISKEVVDYVGLESGLPLAVSALEDALDETSGSARWVKGDATTIASLDAEKWDFHSATDDNLRLYNAAVESKDAALIARFLVSGAPVTLSVAPTEKAAGVQPPLCVASGRGEEELVDRMLSNAKTVPQDVRNLCLRASASAGSLPLVNLWLERGADPVAPPTADWRDHTAIAGAVGSGRAAVVERLLQFKVDLKALVQEEPILIWAAGCRDRCQDTPEIVRLLCKAGADVNARDWNGRQPIFTETSPEVLAELLRAGADIESRNNQGETPLMHFRNSEVIVRGLLARGANPVVADNRGQTAYQAIKQGGCQPCIAMMEAELKRRGLELK